MAALKEEWQAAKAEREQAEARVAQIEGEERDLRAESDAVERLRAAWKDWSGALDAEPGLARQLLRKVLACPIAVFPRDRGQWSFGGYSRFDSLLTGRITPEETTVAKWTNREAIDALVRSHPEWVDPGVSAWAAAPIGGGSDCTSMRDLSRPPCKLAGPLWAASPTTHSRSATAPPGRSAGGLGGPLWAPHLVQCRCGPR